MDKETQFGLAILYVGACLIMRFGFDFSFLDTVSVVSGTTLFVGSVYLLITSKKPRKNQAQDANPLESNPIHKSNPIAEKPTEGTSSPSGANLTTAPAIEKMDPKLKCDVCGKEYARNLLREYPHRQIQAVTMGGFVPRGFVLLSRLISPTTPPEESWKRIVSKYGNDDWWALCTACHSEMQQFAKGLLGL